MLPLLTFLACAPPAADPPGDSPVETDSGSPCPVGEVLDGDGCVPEACGVGAWGGLAVGDTTVYVDAAAGDGGDGTESAPFPSILAGADLAGERGGGLVAIAAGTYTENLVLGRTHDGVHLAGRCAELVTVDGSTLEDTPALYVGSEARRAEVEVSGLTFTGGYVGLWADHASLSAHDVTVTANVAVGVYAQAGAVVSLVNAVISETSPIRGQYGRGIDVEDGAEVTAASCTVADNSEVGVYANGAGTEVDLEDCTITRTRPRSDGTAGNALQAADGALLTAERSTFTANHEIAVRVDGQGSVVNLVESRVEVTEASGDGSGGRGAQVTDGGRLTATGSTFSGNQEVGVAAIEAGSVVELVDSVVSGTVANDRGEYGFGVVIERGATGTLTRTLVDGNTQVAVNVIGAGSALEVDGSTVTDTRVDADGAHGHGIEVSDGAALVMRASTVAGCSGLGVGVTGAGSTAVLTGGSIEGTAPTSEGDGGVALGATQGAAVTTQGLSVVDTVGTGVYVRDGGSRLTLEACTIAGTRAAPIMSGRGVEVAYGASVEASGCTVEGSEGVGVLAAGPDTRVTLRDSTVSGTLRTRDAGLAVGVGAQADAAVVLEGGTIEDTAGPGVYVAKGSASIDACEILGNSFAGVVVLSYSDVRVEDSLIADTLPDAELGGGFGLYARYEVADLRVVLTGSTIGPHRYAAVWLDGPSTYELVGNDLSAGSGFTLGAATLHGNAVFAWNGVRAWDGATGLYLAENRFHGGENVAVLLHGAGAVLDADQWQSNTVDLLQQACAGVEPLTADDLSGASSASVCPDGNILIDTSATFETLYLPEADVED